MIGRLTYSLTHLLAHQHRYILIEGKTELAVRQAKRELQRVLDEETLRVSAGGGRQPTGRYSVI